MQISQSVTEKVKSTANVVQTKIQNLASSLYEFVNKASPQHPVTPSYVAGILVFAVFSILAFILAINFCAIAAKHSNLKISNREIVMRYNRTKMLYNMMREKMNIDRRIIKGTNMTSSSSYLEDSFQTSSYTSTSEYVSHAENHYANVSDVILERSNDDEEGDSSLSKSLL